LIILKIILCGFREYVRIHIGCFRKEHDAHDVSFHPCLTFDEHK